MQAINHYLATHQERFLDELFALLRIPSISTDPAYKSEVEAAATFVKEKLLAAGSDTAYLIHGEGHPLVYAEKKVHPDLPTVLVYGHYDVQPPEPLDLWETPPFEPTIRDNKIYARGASDDKGQLYMHIKVLETMNATHTLPCNLKFLIEGEEENGSSHLYNFIAAPVNQELIQADAIVVSDTIVTALDTPSMEISLRGIDSFEMTIHGPARDLHSGVYGGAVANPIEVLSKIIAQIKDENGHIQIPGFYDDVFTCSEEEKKNVNAQPFNLEKYKKDIGIPDIAGEKGYTTLERLGIRPALDFNGIYGGYTGHGTKTVLPAQATAKFTIRTVPNQDGTKIRKQIEEYIRSLVPLSTKLTFKTLSKHIHRPFKAHRQGLAMQAASQAFEKVWGKKNIDKYRGSSIPILAAFQHILGTDVVPLGFGLNSDQIHAPNEHFGIPNFLIGMKTIAAFHRAFADLHN